MPKVNDLRSFLQVLEGNNQLVRIEKPVSLHHELANVLATLERKDGPAAIFTTAGDQGIPVVGSALASHERIALALGCKKEEIVDALGAAIANPIPPRYATAPLCQEVIMKGEEVDLYRLPIPFHAQGDAGPFITGGVTFSKDPATGRGNCSYQRMQLKGRNKLGIMINEWRHLRGFLAFAEKQNQPLPIAVAIGLDPAIMIAAGIRTERDEIEIAGGIRGEPIEIARGATVDINVPARAEIVVEGRIIPGVRESEGPLAEFTGHYGALWDCPVFEVTAICHRREPIFQTIVPGSFEHVNLGNVLPREPILRQFVRHVAPQVSVVHLTPYSGGFMAVAALEKDNPGQPKNVALAALASHVNIRICIVVDPDINIFVPSEVLFALSTRVDWKEDVFLVPHAQGHELDLTGDERGVQTKIGIDATLVKGRRKEYHQRVVYPEVDLGTYIQAQK